MSYAGPAMRGSRLTGTGKHPSERSKGRGSGRGPGYPDLSVSRSPRQDSDKLTVFASGLALGLLVGGGVALLFAPAAGQDVRRAIARRGKRVHQRGGDVWDDLRHELHRIARKRRRRREREEREGD